MSHPLFEPVPEKYAQSRRPSQGECLPEAPYGLGPALDQSRSLWLSKSGLRPLKIAHIGPCMSRGGAEQQLIDLARFLNPQRYVLAKCLVLPGGRIDPNVVRDLDCPVETATRKAIQRALQEYDICLFWGMNVDQHVDQDPHRRAVRLFLAHGDSWWTQDLIRGSRKSIDHVIAVSEGVRRETCDEFEHTVILNGVDTARLATTSSRGDVRRRFGYLDQDFVVGFVGRLAPEKNVEGVIRSLALLPRKFKGLFVGWGPLKPQLLEMCNDLIPNRYVFVSAERYLGDYYQAMDAFTLLSQNEGFALVFLEAMFAGLPIVATKVGAVPEVIIPGVNGLTVDGHDNEVAAALKRLEQHPHWARGMGREAREYAMQQGHASRMARQYEELFDRLLARRSQTGQRPATPAESGPQPVRCPMTTPYGLAEAPYGLQASGSSLPSYGLTSPLCEEVPYGLAASTPPTSSDCDENNQ